MTTEKVWEGRGDALGDARRSTLPGSVVDDMRLTGLHFRLLAHMGRQNAARGWLRVSQSELEDTWGVRRQSINKAIRDLEDWGYLIKRGQAETRESFCLYKVLDERVDIAPPGERPQNDVDMQVLQGSVSPEGECRPDATPPGGEAEASRGVSRQGDTGVTSEATRVSPLTTQEPVSPVSPKNSPPLPPASGRTTRPGRTGGGGRIMVDWIEALRADGVHPLIVDELFGRLLASGLRPWRDVDPLAVAREVAAEFSQDGRAVIDRVREAVRSEFNHRLPPFATFRALAAAARDEVEAVEARERHLARLPEVRCDAAATERLMAGLRRVAPPEFIRSWYADAGVERVDARCVRIVSPHPPATIAKFDGHGAGVVRAIWGADVGIEYVRGRCVFAASGRLGGAQSEAASESRPDARTSAAPAAPPSHAGGRLPSGESPA